MGSAKLSREGQIENEEYVSLHSGNWYHIAAVYDGTAKRIYEMAFNMPLKAFPAIWIILEFLPL